MRTTAIAVLLAAIVLAGEGGVELVCEFGEGEAEAAAKVLARRLELLEIEGATTKALEDGKRVVLRLDTRHLLDEVRVMAQRLGHLELRRVVNPGTPGYEERRQALADALGRGDEAPGACAIPPESLTEAERKRWPGGLRWCRNPNPTEWSEDWVLCEIDGWGITEEAFDRVRVERSIDDTGWALHFDVKEGFRKNMAELSRIAEGEEDARLAVIVDGEVMAAPVLRAPLSRNGQISMRDEADALALAVAFGGRLPSKPKLIEERAIDR